MWREWKKERWMVSTDPALQDVDAIHAFLRTTYWAQDIPREIVARAVRHSLCFGLFDGTAQIGLARVVTDYATFAYLCDVYVLEAYRGRGLGHWLIECVMAHPQMRELRRINLVTRDAHRIYAAFGFKPVGRPENHLELRRPDLYRRDAREG